MKDTEIYRNLEEEDMILFDNRAQPLKVVVIEDNHIKIEGPSGGEYILFVAEEQDRVLISKEGRRDYASYIDNLRKVGKWQKTGENTWTHSKSGVAFKLEKAETGYWTIKTDDFNLEEEIDIPMYGYSDREFAEEEVKKFIRKHPEG